MQGEGWKEEKRMCELGYVVQKYVEEPHVLDAALLGNARGGLVGLTAAAEALTTGAATASGQVQVQPALLGASVLVVPA